MKSHLPFIGLLLTNEAGNCMGKYEAANVTILVGNKQLLSDNLSNYFMSIRKLILATNCVSILEKRIFQQGQAQLPRIVEVHSL